MIRISIYSWFGETQVKDLTDAEREELAASLREKYGKDVEFY